DGVYAFAVTSNDGSVLEIDDLLVVDNDGGHGARRITGRIGLRRGVHRWRLLYFQLGGGRALRVEWQPPEQPWRAIPAQFFYHCSGRE
ncbi:MAG TPA: metallophosphatase, partial [Bacteroidetes bacterium]|nr:metallophosphatase [Bacteroidota bacterium]